jgi:hypothetical protein
VDNLGGTMVTASERPASPGERAEIDRFLGVVTGAEGALDG